MANIPRQELERLQTVASILKLTMEAHKYFEPGASPIIIANEKRNIDWRKQADEIIKKSLLYLNNHLEVI